MPANSKKNDEYPAISLSAHGNVIVDKKQLVESEYFKRAVALLRSKPTVVKPKKEVSSGKEG